MLVDDRRDTTPRNWPQRLKPMRFDAALVFNTNTRNALAVWRAGIRQRVCWAYKPIGMLLGNRRVAVHRSHPPIHESEFALAFVRRLGAKPSRRDCAPTLEIDTATRQAGRRRASRATSAPPARCSACTRATTTAHTTGPIEHTPSWSTGWPSMAG